MQRTRTAETYKYALAGIATLLDRNFAQSLRHMRFRQAHDTVREGVRRRQCAARSVKRSSSAFFVEFHFTAQKIVRIQPAQRQIGVRHSRPLPKPIAGRSGIGASGFGTNTQSAAAVETGERSAACAYGMYI